MLTDTAWVAIAAGIGTFLGSLVGGIFNYLTTIGQRKPEVIQHQCRLSRLDIYTYITGRKRQTPPACVWLDQEDQLTCQYDPSSNTEIQMKALHRNYCYLAYHAGRHDLA